MAITTVSTPITTYDVTDAGFRKWAKAWHDTLVALDLTVVYTGIDFSTVTVPAVAQTVAGSVVYEINDSVSSERSLYIKIGYGRGSTSNGDYGYRLDMTVGNTHDGSGNVGGYSKAHYLITPQGSTGDGEILGVRGDTGIVLYGNITLTNKYQPLILIERLSIDGVPTGDGVQMVVMGHAVNTTSASANDAQGSVTNFVTGFIGTAATVGNPAPCLMSYNVDRSYMSKSPLYSIQTYGGYDPLHLLFQTGGQPLGVDNAVFTGTFRDEAAVFRTVNGSRWVATSYVKPAVRMG